MRKFLLVTQLLFNSTLALAQQEPVSGQYNYISTISSLDTTLNNLSQEDFMIQIADDKVALVMNDTLVNIWLSRIVKIGGDTWLIRDSLEVYCKLDSFAEALMISIGECSKSSVSTGDTTINNAVYTLQQNYVECNGVSFTDKFAFDQNDFIGAHSMSWAIVLPVLPAGEAYLPTLLIKEIDETGKATVTYNLVSKSSNVSQTLFDISATYKEVSYLEFMSSME